MECPSCRSALVKRQSRHGYVYVCPACSGMSMVMAVLRKAGAKHEFLSELWQKSRQKNARRVRPCPHCARRMTEVRTNTDGQELILDVCPVCPAIWFDAKEFKAVPRTPPPPKPVPMTAKAREQAAILVLERIKHQQETEAGSDGPEESWQWLAGLLGLPVELNAPQVSRTPWITWLLVAACIFVTLWASMGDVSHWTGIPIPNHVESTKDVFHEWGFIPAEWDRKGGITLITAFFLHGGLWHLLGNMYFLLVFGDNVEERIGRYWYVLLLLSAHAAGTLLHATFDGRPQMPVIGASAGISGVIAYYAIAFPRVRLGFMFRYFICLRWIRLSAIWALALYALMQLAGVYFQVNGFSNVSSLGHLGGLTVGLSAALLHRYLQKQEVSRVTGFSPESR